MTLKKLNSLKRLLFLLPLLWMGVIFSFSSMTGTQSSAVSNPISSELAHIIKGIIPALSIEQLEKITDILEVIVRKTAHMTEYGLLYLWWYIALCQNGVRKYALWLSFLLAAGYGATDEIHQLFVSARSGQVRDVCIDSLGAGIVMVLCYCLRKKER